MNTRVLIILLSPFFLGACGRVEAPVTSPTRAKANSFSNEILQQAPQESERYVYRGDTYRDPFIPITSEDFFQRSPDGVMAPDIHELLLQGIIRDGNQSIALLKSGSNSYTLLNGRVYDSRQRLIEGMKGFIESESVVITAPDGTRREIMLRQKNNY